jgi:hypothetical protein
LGDEHQAVLAQRILGPSEERAQRLHLGDQVAEAQTGYGPDPIDSTAGEARAWECLIEAHAGLLAFHALVHEGTSQNRGIRGSWTSTRKSFHLALQGYHTAFPDEMVSQGVQRALDSATEHCLAAFTRDLDATREIPDVCQRLQTTIQNAIALEVQQ